MQIQIFLVGLYLSEDVTCLSRLFHNSVLAQSTPYIN